MRRRHAAAGAWLVALAMSPACGSSSAPTASPSPLPSSSAPPPVRVPNGSWDVAIAAPYGSVAARLDVGDDAIAVTPRWGDSATFEADAGVLSGNAPYDGGTIQSIVLDVGDAGVGPSAAVTIGTSDGASSSFAATVGPDVTPPQARYEGKSPLGLGDLILPWDAIDVRIAEPIDPSTLALLVTNQIENDAPLDVAWATPAGPFGAVLARGTLVDWGKNEVLPHLRVAAGYEDPSHHAGSALDTVVQMINVEGGLTYQETFDQEDPGYPEYAPYGVVTQLGGIAGADPRCEEIGCIQLGPVALGSCGVDVALVAVRLRTPAPVSTLTLRVRLATSTASLPADAKLLSAQIALPGMTPELATAALVPVTMGDGLDGEPYVSAWTTVSFPVHASGAELGVAVVAGDFAARKGCDGAAARDTMSVLVDSIFVE